MQKFVVILFLLLSTPVQAVWYENQRIDWWVVVFSQMRCAQASEFNVMFRPAQLVNIIGCEYEGEYSVFEHVASIGCEHVEGLNTGFIFTTDKEYCERYLIHLFDAMQQDNL